MPGVTSNSREKGKATLMACSRLAQSERVDDPVFKLSNRPAHQKSYRAA
jgi:hypothetical protein